MRPMRRDEWLCLDGALIRAGHGGSLLEVCHKHGSLFDAERVVPIPKLLQGRLIELG